MSSYNGKWSISTDEEHYDGLFDTLEDAIEEGKASKYGGFYVGQCIAPVQPEDLFNSRAVETWLEYHVYEHDDYSGEWAEGQVSPTAEQEKELAAEIRPLIAAWLDRHKLRPTFWIIDQKTVQYIDADDATAERDEQ